MKRIELLIIIVEIIIILGLGVLIGLVVIENNKQEQEKNIVINPHTTIVEDGIKYKTYNAIAYQFISDSAMCSTYFNQYKEKLLNSPKEAYELLDETYKQERFDSLENFQAYVENNKDYIARTTLKTYKRTSYEDYNLYTLEDSLGNRYLFKETAVMEYKVQLDDYTLENEEFKERYVKATNRDKGILNVDKFFKMINMKDYTSAYEVLDENFKQNYFKTQADFENYIKTKTFNYNKVEYKEYSGETTDIYVYKVSLTDMLGENVGEIEFNIVMKILEGTEFVMSFEIN